MHIVHITGRSRNGKTTLIVELVREITRRGLRVGTLKHSGHDHHNREARRSSLYS